MRYNGLRGVLTLMMLAIACGGNTVSEPPVPSPTPSVEPTPLPFPTPQPTPATCPALQEWGSKIHNIMDGGFQPTDVIRAGGYVVGDSTPKFEVGGPNGQPCNGEHPENCGGRMCEDPRGGKWKLLKGGSPWKAQEVYPGYEAGPDTGFQIKIGPLVEGQHEWEICPLGDVRDGEGFPVEVRAGACDRVGFFVLP